VDLNAGQTKWLDAVTEAEYRAEPKR
jgi:hypothetical protein